MHLEVKWERVISHVVRVNLIKICKLLKTSKRQIIIKFDPVITDFKEMFDSDWWNYCHIDEKRNSWEIYSLYGFNK